MDLDTFPATPKSASVRSSTRERSRSPLPRSRPGGSRAGRGDRSAGAAGRRRTESEHARAKARPRASSPRVRPTAPVWAMTPRQRRAEGRNRERLASLRPTMRGRFLGRRRSLRAERALELRLLRPARRERRERAGRAAAGSASADSAGVAAAFFLRPFAGASRASHAPRSCRSGDAAPSSSATTPTITRPVPRSSPPMVPRSRKERRLIRPPHRPRSGSHRRGEEEPRPQRKAAFRDRSDPERRRWMEPDPVPSHARARGTAHAQHAERSGEPGRRECAEHARLVPDGPAPITSAVVSRGSRLKRAR
jgi:THO complex subunit 2